MDTKVRIELESGQALNSIRDLRKAIKESKDEMVGLEEGSDAFLKAAKKAGELQHQMDAIQQSVRGASSDFGDMLGNITKAGAGITGAFQAAQGAMTLFGAESEDVTKAIQKMQSIMAMTQGLAAIDEGIKSFKKFSTAIGSSSKSLGGFKKALIGTGLGALVVVLGSIIANWDEFSEAIGISSKQMEKFGEIAGGVLNVVTSGVKGLTKAISRAITGDWSGALDALKEGFDVKETYAEGVEKTITKRVEEEEKKRLEAAKKALEEYKKIQEERRKAAIQAYEDALVTRQALEGLFDKSKDVKDPGMPALEEEEEDLSYKDKLQEYAEAKKLLDEISFGDTYLEGLQVQEDALKASLDKRLIDEKAYNTASNALAKKRTAYHMQMAAAAASEIGNVFNSLADLEEGATKESFERQKGLQIAGATMSMLAGITAAISGLFTTKSGPWDIALAAIQASAIAASGIVNIAKIKQQTFEGSGAARANVTSPAMALSSPIQMTQDIQGASIEESIKDTKVIVTETDITNTQKKVDVAETESKF